ncbi:MAG: AAA-like domain-containing protein [Snowella sp.]|nr:AAA-like domain-containing protein [Snowella sp.]
MKPQGWDQFLQEITHDYDLHGKLKEVFLVRFAYENWRKSDLEVWELAEAASHETYKKQMTQIYSYFAKDKPNGCPELDPSSKGPGKFQIVREWLKDIKYQEWHQLNNKPVNTGLTVNLQPIAQSDSTVYIPRSPVESDCLQEITKPGSLIRIKSPEKTGKTSLVKFILNQVKASNFQTVYLNFQTAEAAMFSSLDKFLRWFCANISRELGIKPQLDDYWDEELFGSLISCKTYFQSHLLEQINQPLVLGLDNLDRVFEYVDIAQDFLPMLRFWHEEANNIPIWQNLRLIIANSTEVYIKLDANQSPFNVGRQIKLPGFNLEQVNQLAKTYGFSEVKLQEIQPFLKDLIELVGGHPYLVRLALNTLSRDQLSPEQLLTEAPTQGGIYSAHLRHHWNNLQSSNDLVTGMKKVVNSPIHVKLEPAIAYRLESMGLISLMGDEASSSCPLYQQYFQDNL